MNKYVNQLIGQFHESAKNVPPPPETSEHFNLDDPGEEEDFQYVEKYIYGIAKPLSEIFGIEKIYLPDDEKLTDEQVETLASEAEKLWNAYHFHPVFPENLPPRLCYRKIREYWDNEQVFIGVGQAHIEFCDFNEKECPFQGYCTICSEIEAELEDNHSQTTHDTDIDELPDWVKDDGDNDNDNDDDNDNDNDFQLNDTDQLLPTAEDMENFARGMRKDKIKDYIKNRPTENHVTAIHNYCDRWCEKCAFTSRCGSYALEKELYPSDEEKDIRNEEFWDNLSLIYESTAELLKEKMEELNIEIDNNDIDVNNFEEETIKHPLSVMSKRYSKEVHEWMNRNESEIELILSYNSSGDINFSLSDASDTILWYHVFIFVKLQRAISGSYEKDEGEVMNYDMNGSAKIARIAVERSIGAWGVMLQQYPRCEDEIFDFIKTLNKIQKTIIQHFPDSESFIRPGFDEC